jgi:AcrR family transcriptional regulator
MMENLLGGAPPQGGALELFAEQGFERTTVAEIAERAGLTKRTFFNHFADKREVLFGRGAERQREIATSEITACPAGLPPLDAVGAARVARLCRPGPRPGPRLGRGSLATRRAWQ